MTRIVREGQKAGSESIPKTRKNAGDLIDNYGIQNIQNSKMCWHVFRAG